MEACTAAIVKENPVILKSSEARFRQIIHLSPYAEVSFAVMRDIALKLFHRPDRKELSPQYFTQQF